ncbi:hypothetical protein B4U79_17559 [Dinothrombium tinctorium]|uniref:FAD linked oxidase N-terminal domain-containing protein n=1 Tax=Dinothrombium tinctorium TaxID=1965070 RepID=A0A3S3PA27_9ACAR|nr:hypothetical protein B4U79_17559 [Dinothrombium tinctorium]
MPTTSHQIVSEQDVLECVKRHKSKMKLVFKNDSGYEQLVGQWNSIEPRGFFLAQSSRDVQIAVKCSRLLNLDIALENGVQNAFDNNSFFGIKFSSMNKVIVNRQKRIVLSEAGADMELLKRECLSQGVALPFPNLDLNSLSDFTLNGGFGFSSRQYGLMSDRLLEVEIVTAKGDILRANPFENSDLFWALRGGGDENYGIATKFIFEAFYAPPLVIRVEKNYENPQDFVWLFDNWLSFFAKNPHPSISSQLQFNLEVVNGTKVTFVIIDPNFHKSMLLLQELILTVSYLAS